MVLRLAKNTSVIKDTCDGYTIPNSCSLISKFPPWFRVRVEDMFSVNLVNFLLVMIIKEGSGEWEERKEKMEILKKKS